MAKRLITPGTFIDFKNDDGITITGTFERWYVDRTSGLCAIIIGGTGLIYDIQASHLTVQLENKL